MNKEFFFSDNGKRILTQYILTNEILKEFIYSRMKTTNLSNAQIDMIKVMSAMNKEWKKRGIYLGVPIANIKAIDNRKYEIDAMFSNHRKYSFEMDGTLGHKSRDDDEKDEMFFQNGRVVIRLRSKSLGKVKNGNTIIIPDNRLPMKKQKELIMYINSIFNLDYIDYHQILSNEPSNRKDFLISFNIENNNEFVEQIFNLISGFSGLRYELQAY